MSAPLAPTQVWWTSDEIAAAALPDMPITRQGVDGLIKRNQWRVNRDLARRRAGKGGGWEYSWQLFADRARRKLLAQAADHAKAPVVPVRQSRDEAWAWFEALPQSVKSKAEARLKIVQQVEALELLTGRGRHNAIADVARICGDGARTIASWFAMIDGVRADDRLAYLAPRNRAAAARQRSKDCEPEFFEVIKSLFLRPAAPCFTDCYRDAIIMAVQQNWDVLPERTMRRRLDASVSQPVQILARKGLEALQRIYPPQVRDKTCLTAMEAVNADFHKFDVFVSWPAPFGQNEPGQIVRPQMVCFQDIYSGRILSWRMDLTPNSTAVQLAAGDMIEDWGIPAHVLFDNGREFGAKAITGGATNRFRFKIKEDDIDGLFTNLNCKIHWATPYHGQAKPIERAFRDMCHSISKDVRFDGAYTGNTPLAKPEDYGSRAIPLDYFLKVVGERIARHNTQQDRQSVVAYKRSFAEVFDESYASAPISKATEAQRRLWLLGTEGLRADTNTGAVWFQKNEFWDAWMHEIAGQRVIVRFDPADFLAGVHIYSQDNAYLGHAPVRQAVGFFDADEARVHARARKDWMNLEKKTLAALRKYNAIQLGGMLDDVAPVAVTPIEAKVVKPVFGKGAKPGRDKPNAAYSADHIADVQAALVTQLSDHRAAAPVAVGDEAPKQVFQRAMELEAILASGGAITPEQRQWLARYQTTPDCQSQRIMWDSFGDAYFA